MAIAVGLNLSVHLAVRVVFKRQRDRDAPQAGVSVLRDFKCQRALVVERQFAQSCIFGGAVEPQVILGYVNNRVIEDRDRGGTFRYVAEPARAYQSNIGVDASGAQECDHQAGFVLAVAETAREHLRHRIRLVTINAEFERDVVRVSQDELMNGLDLVAVSLGSLKKLIEGAAERGVQRKLRSDKVGVPTAYLFPGRKIGYVNVRSYFSERRLPWLRRKSAHIAHIPAVEALAAANLDRCCRHLRLEHVKPARRGRDQYIALQFFRDRGTESDERAEVVAVRVNFSLRRDARVQLNDVALLEPREAYGS